MAIKYEVSYHAERRFRERFYHINLSLNQLLENSIIFGAQKGAEYFLLNQDHKLVFVVTCETENSKHIIKTVLTLDQAKANLSMAFGIEFETTNIAEKVENIRKQSCVQKQPEQKITQEHIEKLKMLGEDFARKYGYVPTGKEQKEVFKKIKSLIPVSNKILNSYFLPEIGRVIRERNLKA